MLALTFVEVDFADDLNSLVMIFRGKEVEDQHFE